MNQFMYQTTFELLNIAIFVVRLFIGSCFIVHGLGKLGYVGTGNMKTFTGWLKALKVPYPALQARLAMSAELVGGACLVLGFCLRPAAIVLMFTMLIAGVIGHKGAGYLITNTPPGNEYTVNLAAILFMLLLTGARSYSIDALLF